MTAPCGPANPALDPGGRCCACGQLVYQVRAVSERRSNAISSPGAAYEAVRSRLRGNQEKLVAVYLNAQNEPLGKPVVVSMGSLNTTRTHPREILLPGIERSALGFILAHNHPSGSTAPSQEDVGFTSTVKQAAELVGFLLYDHLIVSTRKGKEGFVSLKERGLL